MGFIGVAIGLTIGILIYSEIEQVIPCPNITLNPDGNESCTKAKSISWSVIGILPISLFMGLFSIFGGFNRI